MSMATRFILKNVRLSFPVLEKPKAGPNGGEEKFGANFIIDKNDTENVAVLREKLIAALTEKFPDRSKLPPVLRGNDLNTYVSIEGKDGWPLRNGDFQDKDGYEGKLFIHATNRSVPFTIDGKNCNVSPKMFYAGCYVDAALEAYAWEGPNNKGVSVSLHGVRFAGDGEPFGASPVSSTDFFPAPSDNGSDNPDNYNV